MSFGFAIGDVIAVGQLAWNLYQNGYKVARGAPQEFQLLLGEISTLSNSMKILQGEVSDPESVLVRAGEDRVRMVNEMVARIKVTLLELQKVTKRHEILSDGTSSKKRQIWGKLKWSVEFGSIDSLRSKLIYHNTVMNLLLTSVGNSSLKRIESTTKALETDVTEIKGFIRETAAKTGRNEVFKSPLVSVVDDEAFRITLSAALMHNAEVLQPWSAIGADQWIQAGRWWLLKSQMELYAVPTSDLNVPVTAYTNLIKASWIMVDIIACHPQLSFLNSSTHYEIQLLSAELKTEFQRVKTLGLVVPDLGELEDQNLQIWETQAKGPLLRPGRKSRKQDVGTTSNLWMVGGEQTYFQRFALYRRNHLSDSLPCMTLFLVHETTNKARLVAQDQNGTALMEVALVQELEVHANGSTVALGNEDITFTTQQDAIFLCSVFEAAKLYFFCPHRDRVDLGDFKGFILMFAVMNRCEDAIMRLMDSATSKDGPTENYGQKALLIGLALASQFVRHELDDEWHSISNARRDPKMSLFAWAVYCGHVDVARLLVEDGADVAEKDSEGNTPLQQAIRNGHEAVARLLLAKGADFDPEVPEESTLLHVAASNGNELEMRLLLERDFEIQAIDEHQWTPLHWAAFSGHQKVAYLLVQAGARLEAVSDIGRTPLHVVNGLEKEDVVQLLLDKGSRIDANDVHNWTPLHVAANSGFAEIVDILLGWGSDIQAKTSGGLTPLHLAASNGHQATIGLLLDNGALVDSTTKRGWTVLHWVAAQGQVQAARMVLERNANIEAEDESGRTPLHVAVSNEQEAMVQLLLERGATSQGSHWAAFRVAASSGNDAILQLLCQQNVDLEAKDKHGRTALLLAALNGHVNVVQTLLLIGADLTSKTNSGWSALHCAVSRRHTSVVQLLLQYTSDINSKCNQGWTALHRASSVGDEMITRLLLNRGAHIEELDGSGLTPLQRAAHNDHANVVSLLLAHGRNSMRIRNGPGFSVTGLVSENEAFLSRMFKSLQRLEDNWDNGLCVKFQIPHSKYPKETHTSQIYTIQYSQKYIVSGSMDQSIRIWDLDRRRLEINNAKRLSTGTSLPGHSKSVLCLQFDHSPEEDVIISGSVDRSIIIWRFSTGEIVHMIKNAHQGSILSLKFDQKYLVTASKDKLIKVWNRHEILPTDDEFSWVYQSGDPFAVALRETSASIIPIYSELRVISGHNSAINSIQLLNDEIVSASGDRTVRVWCIRTGKCLLCIADAHTKGIACLQYDGTWIITGSSDNTIGVFDRLTGSKVIKLEGHDNLVRSVQSKIYDLTTVDDPEQSSIDDVDQSLTKLKISDEPAFRRASKIVSGSYDETIKIWRRDHEGKWFLRKTLHSDNPDTASHRIFNVQFDSRFLVYATQDNEIKGCDFANGDPEIIEAVTWLASL